MIPVPRNVWQHVEAVTKVPSCLVERLDAENVNVENA